jgi:hypothetical protein
LERGDREALETEVWPFLSQVREVE